LPAKLAHEHSSNANFERKNILKKIIKSTVENGKEVYFIPLGNSGKEAAVCKDDWDMVRSLYKACAPIFAP